MTMMMTMLDGLSRATDVVAADSGSSLPLTPTWHHKTPKNYKKNARHSSAIYFKITLCFREELSQCLQDNSPTNQLVVSQVTDWSTRRQRFYFKSRKDYTIFYTEAYRTTRRQTNSRSVNSRTGQLADSEFL